VRIPRPCHESARIVADRMGLLVSLRGTLWATNEPFVFASDFAQAYCALTADQIRGSKNWLEREGVIYRFGMHGGRSSGSLLPRTTQGRAAGWENRRESS
jgi:hypothetical protein